MRKNVVILFGGKSPEHEISVKTAYNVFKAMDPDQYDVHLVGISKTNSFYYLKSHHLEELAKKHERVEDDDGYLHATFWKNVLRVFTNAGDFLKERDFFYWLECLEKSAFQYQLDIVISLIHGVQGEDGIIQGFLEMLGVPYVGCGVKASALCMDKDVTKRILKSHDIPVVDWITLKEYEKINEDDIINTLGLPIFVKAAEQGSSIGTYKAVNKKELKESIQKAFEYGPKVILEKAVQGREIECAILGNGNALTVSNLGEIVPSEKYGFYSYDAKYMDPDGAKLSTSVSIDKSAEADIKRLAEKAFKALDCSGLSRIDFFVTDDNQIYLNEINTMPGFTSISMYPTLMIQNGIPYDQLIKTLIDLGIEAHKQKQSYKQV